MQMLHLAQKNAGQIISLSWNQKPDPNPYTLEAFYPEPRELFQRKQQSSASVELKWSHFHTIDDEKTTLWVHETNDVELVLNMVAPESSDSAKTLSDESGWKPSASKIGMQAHTASKTGTRHPVLMTPRSNTKEDKYDPNAVTLAGNLKDMELTSILQSISLCKMTGRLDIQDRLDSTEVFFEDGSVVHAIFQRAMGAENDKAIAGDQAMLNVLTWDSGSFFFYPSRKTSERTIRRKLEGLLLEGATLRDYNNYLRQAEVSPDSCLHKLSDSLTEAELEEKLSAGVPIDRALQKKFYEQIDGRSSISAIADQLGINRMNWTPVVFNLITCELASVDSATKSRKLTSASDIVLDKSAIKQASRELLRAETGLSTYPLAMHFLELELARHQGCGAPFSIAIFDVLNKKEPLSNADLRRIAENFRSRSKSYDMLGHYKSLEFVILLPLKEDHQSREFVESFANALYGIPFEDVKKTEDLHLRFGIASVPSDCSSIEELLSAAENAKRYATEEKRLCAQARELRWEEYRTSGEQALKEQKFTEAEASWTAAFNEAQAFADDDERLLISLERLSQVLKQRGKSNHAEPLLTSLVQIKTRLFGPNSIEVADAAGELAHCYFSTGKYNEAEPLLKKLLTIYVKELGERHHAVATWLYRLATLYHILQRYIPAEAAYKRALAISKVSLGADHATTRKIAESYRAMRNTLSENGESLDPGLITGTWEPVKLDKPVVAKTPVAPATP
jgi:GGDEF domain-containing protein